MISWGNLFLFPSSQTAPLWRRISPGGPSSPSPRSQHSLRKAGHFWVIFGGVGWKNRELGDTWILDLRLVGRGETVGAVVLEVAVVVVVTSHTLRRTPTIAKQSGKLKTPNHFFPLIFSISYCSYPYTARNNALQFKPSLYPFLSFAYSTIGT